jgi:uncharacterized protein YciI
MSGQFLYVFTPGLRPELGAGLDAWTADDHIVLDQHFAYLAAGATAGTVVMAGRSQDGIGPAIVILETPDEATARSFMEHDPFLTSGLFGATLHPFRIALERD